MAKDVEGLFSWLFRLPLYVSIPLIVGGWLLINYPPEWLRPLAQNLGPLFVVLGVVLLIGHLAQGWKGSKSMTPQMLLWIGIAGSVAFLIVTVAAAVWLRTSPTQRGDIAWDFDSGVPSFFLGFASFETKQLPVGTDITKFVRPSFDIDKTYVMGFQANGRNQTSKGIESVSGFIRSDITNETKAIYLAVDAQSVPPDQTNGIPANAGFSVNTVAPGKNNLQADGIPAKTFMQEFPSFTFVFQYDGQTFTRHFSHQEVQAQLDLFIAQTDPAAANVPRVTRKNP